MKKISVMDDIPEKFFNNKAKRSSKGLKDIKMIYPYLIPKLISETTSIFSVKYSDNAGNDIDKIVRNLPEGKMSPTKNGVWLTDINAKKKGVGNLVFIEYDKVIGLGMKNEIHIVKRTESIKLKNF